MNLEGVGDLQKKQTARSHKDCEPSGGLVGIDQEVVTLTWPLRQLRVRLIDDPDRPSSGGINPYCTGSVRAVASGALFVHQRCPKPRLEQPL